MPPQVWIDLTSDDEDAIAPMPTQTTQVATLPQPIPLRTYSHGLTNSKTNGAFKAPVYVPPQSVSSQSERKPVIEPSQEPPAKRRRVSPSASAQTPTLNKEQLFQDCYVKHLWPCISMVVKALPPDYSNDHLRDLGHAIFDRVADEALDAKCEANGFRLSKDDEQYIRQKAERLARELKDRPDLWSLPSPESSDGEEEAVRPKPNPSQLPNGTLSSVAKSPSAVIPSIENDPINGSNEVEFDVNPEYEDVDEEYQDAVRSLDPQLEDGFGEGEEDKVLNNDELQGSSFPPPIRPEYFSESEPPLVSQFSNVQPVIPRPYLSAEQRRSVLKYNGRTVRPGFQLRRPCVFHIDFDDIEVGYLQSVSRSLFGESTRVTRSPFEDLRHTIKKANKMKRLDELLQAHEAGYASSEQKPPNRLLQRSRDELATFLSEVRSRRAGTKRNLTLNNENGSAGGNRIDPVPSLLFTREIMGNRAFGFTRRYVNFTTAFKSDREDDLQPRIEWTNCAGDIATISWVSDTQFICGTTTHSDSHNQQYNKPGNLLLGSSKGAGTLQAYPDHRIIRPVVSHGDNALDSMVESQDPWLFSSVVSSDYDSIHRLAFTSSFDETVKVWRVQENDTMEALATWKHTGRVNFVVASEHPSGLVATAADILTEAVRVYHIENGSQLQNAHFDSYSCMKIHDEDYVPSYKWGYCPASVRWGLRPEVQHLLLIGYSPRSLQGHDHEIPEEKVNTGELCVWDTVTKTQIKVIGGSTQNVFEVAWHPFRNSFAAATSKADSLDFVDDDIRTQIRIFVPNEDGQYASIKTLDCAAMDINELTIRPNSTLYFYVAASCTDGNVYVWDTSGTDEPMCILEHGEPVEELLGDREHEDVGVKFAAWATTGDRLYTGSSDGVVKAWNIRHGEGVLLRNLLEVAGPITYGAFSPDNTKLVIGDGTGRVYLLALDEAQENTRPLPGPGFFNVNLGRGRQRAIRRPRPFTCHEEVPAPDAKNGAELARGYIEREELSLLPVIGAVQGPQYYNTGFFRNDAHLDEDGNKPLLGAYERHQQENVIRDGPRRVPRIREFRELSDIEKFHEHNTLIEDQFLDPDAEFLDIITEIDLQDERVEVVPDYDFKYEEQPDI